MKRILFLLFAILLVSACSSQTDGEGVSFQEQADDEFGTDVYIPQLEDYSITSVEVQHLPHDDKDLVITYSEQEGELKDDQFINKYEKNMDTDILYGIYDGEPNAFTVTYNDRSGGSQPSETKSFNGIDVEYHEVKKFLFVYFKVEEGSYLIDFNLNEELSKDKAFEIVDMITSKVNQ
ncbi:lipoprotein [Virgibacillus byunsanensis]|uniref:Lipoprotein n=1 Tax=Virgibacillus byunsanensis TaxID=570945 RepID=A0ABW3LQX1_9BACI